MARIILAEPFGLWDNKGAVPHRACDGGRLMELNVRFFALYRERAGLGHFRLQVPEGATVADLCSEVRRQFPRLAPPDVRIVVAVNAEYADPGLALREGDEVCLIPPVSGG